MGKKITYQNLTRLTLTLFLILIFIQQLMYNEQYGAEKIIVFETEHDKQLYIALQDNLKGEIMTPLTKAELEKLQKEREIDQRLYFTGLLLLILIGFYNRTQQKEVKK